MVLLKALPRGEILSIEVVSGIFNHALRDDTATTRRTIERASLCLLTLPSFELAMSTLFAFARKVRSGGSNRV